MVGRMGRASYRPRYDRTPTPQLTFLSSDDTHSEHPCCLSLRTTPGMFRQSPRSSDSTSDERGDCLNMIPTTLTPQPAPPLSSRGASSEAPTRDTHIRLAPAVRRSGSTASPARVERATSRSRQHLGERERDGRRPMHGLARCRAISRPKVMSLSSGHTQKILVRRYYPRGQEVTVIPALLPRRSNSGDYSQWGLLQITPGYSTTRSNSGLL